MPLPDNPIGERAQELRDNYSNEEILQMVSDTQEVLQARVSESKRSEYDAVHIVYEDGADLDEHTYPLGTDETSEELVEEMSGIVGPVADWSETTLRI